MDVIITGRHMETSEALQQYAKEKVLEGLSSFTRVESVHVILDKEKYRNMAELVVQGKSHLRIDAKAESDDMYVSIDAALDKAVKQLRRSRDKAQNHQTPDMAEAERVLRQTSDEETLSE